MDKGVTHEDSVHKIKKVKDKSGTLTNGLSPVFGGLSVKVWSDLILTFFGRECLPKS